MGPGMEKETSFLLACTQGRPGAMQNPLRDGGNSEPASGCWSSWVVECSQLLMCVYSGAVLELFWVSPRRPKKLCL